MRGREGCRGMVWFNMLLHTGSLKRILYKQDLCFLACFGREKAPGALLLSICFCNKLPYNTVFSVLSSCNFGLPSCFSDDPGATMSCSARRALPDMYLWLLWACRCHVVSGEWQDEVCWLNWRYYRQIQ